MVSTLAAWWIFGILLVVCLALPWRGLGRREGFSTQSDTETLSEISMLNMMEAINGGGNTAAIQQVIQTGTSMNVAAQEPITLRLLYMANDPTFDQTRTGMAPLLADANEMLLMYSCVQYTPALVRELSKAPYKIVNLSTQAASLDQIRAFVVEQLIRISDLQFYGQAIEGPAYLLVSMAPYHRDHRNRMMPVQFNINDLQMAPVVELSHPAPEDAFQGNMMMYLYLLLPRYDAHWQMRPAKDAVRSMDFFKKHRLHEQLCFMACPGDDSFFCGCATQKEPYESRCLGPAPRPQPRGRGGPRGGDDKHTPTTFAILYEINPKSDMVQKSKRLVAPPPDSA